MRQIISNIVFNEVIGTSEKDVNTAKSLNTTVYSIDSWTGVQKGGNAIHRVTGNGTQTNNVGTTTGFNLASDALKNYVEKQKKTIMKKIILILLTIFSLASCSAQKLKSKIIYTLPFAVTERIYEKLKTISNTDGLSFTLGNDTKGNYIVYMNMPKHDEYKFWIENTNRILLIKEKHILSYLNQMNIFPILKMKNQY